MNKKQKHINLSESINYLNHLFILYIKDTKYHLSFLFYILRPRYKLKKKHNRWKIENNDFIKLFFNYYKC